MLLLIGIGHRGELRLIGKSLDELKAMQSKFDKTREQYGSASGVGHHAVVRAAMCHTPAQRRS
ncbi:MAG TPA: hypothetical protein VK459_09570 [Polyangiaceae bacterium]|jgi:hypothetical protein|nr:hypothetical protein [Polyangiaceae bacterium]